MAETARPPLTAVDRIADGNGLQMMKASIPYFPSGLQRFMSLYVKILEIQNVLSYYNNPVSICSSTESVHSPDELLVELRNYGTDEQRQTMDHAINFLNTLKTYQEYIDLLS